MCRCRLFLSRLYRSLRARRRAFSICPLKEFAGKKHWNGISPRLIDRSSWLIIISHKKFPWIVMRTERKENTISPFSRSKRSIDLNNLSADDFPNEISKATLKLLPYTLFEKWSFLTTRKNHIINRLSSSWSSRDAILIASERFRFWSFGKIFIKILEGKRPKILIGSWPDKPYSETDRNE